MSRFIGNPPIEERVAHLTDEIFERAFAEQHRSIDRMFLWLLLAQWVFAIVLAAVFSPYAWEGKVRSRSGRGSLKRRWPSGAHVKASCALRE